MKTPITPEALIEMGFVDTSFKDNGELFTEYSYNKEVSLQVYGNYIIDIQIDCEWHSTNAKTMEDIQDLIRLFK
jgi:hypothetical protein